MNRLVVRVTLDAQPVRSLREKPGDAAECGLRGRPDLGRTAIEKSNLAQADNQSVGPDRDCHLVPANLRRQRIFQFLSKAGQVARLRCSEGSFRIGNDSSQRGRSFCVFDRLHSIKRNRLLIADRDGGARRRKYAQLLERNLDRYGQFSHLAAIDLGRGITRGVQVCQIVGHHLQRLRPRS